MRTTTFAACASGVATSRAMVGPDPQGCRNKSAMDVVKGAAYYDQANWLATKITDGLFGTSGGYQADAPGLPSVPGSSTVSAASTTAGFVAGSKIAQSYVRQAIRAGGGSISMRRVGNLSGTFGKYAGFIGSALTAYSAYQDYQYCMGR